MYKRFKHTFKILRIAIENIKIKLDSEKVVINVSTQHPTRNRRQGQRNHKMTAICFGVRFQKQDGYAGYHSFNTMYSISCR